MQRDQWPKNLTTFSLITPPLKPNISQTLWPWYPNYGHQKEFYYISYYNLSHLCLFITLNNWWIFMCYGFLYHCFSFLMHSAKIGKLKSNFIAQPSSKVRNLTFYHLRKVKLKIDIKEVDSKLIAFPSLIKLEIIQMSFKKFDLYLKKALQQRKWIYFSTFNSVMKIMDPVNAPKSLRRHSH